VTATFARVATRTYAEFDGVVAGVAGGLAGRGLKRGAAVDLALAGTIRKFLLKERG
jgi:hypothetical protein